MAVAVASTSYAQPSTTTNIVITAPSGIAEDDLLVMIACAHNSTLTPPAGWTESYSYSSATIAPKVAKVWYKIATVADESAGSYTVTTTSQDAVGGVIFRITGWATGDPFRHEENALSSVSANGSYAETSLSLDRPSPQVHILFGFGINTDSSGYFTAANYSITSSDANPSWTEVRDGTSATSAANLQTTMVVAYATSTHTSTVTATGFDYTIANTPSIGAIFGYLMICSPQDAAGTSALLEVSPSFFDETAVSVDTNGTSALLEVAPSLPDSNGAATSPTQWTNETKPSTTWTNESV